MDALEQRDRNYETATGAMVTCGRSQGAGTPVALLIDFITTGWCKDVKRAGLARNRPVKIRNRLEPPPTGP